MSKKGELVSNTSSPDITEHKRAEEAQIRDYVQFLGTFIDIPNVWLNVLDNEANVLIWNRAAEEISGYSREEVVGHHKIEEWLYPDEEERRRNMQSIKSIIEKGEPHTSWESTIRCKDGQTKIMSWYSRSLVDDDGKPIGYGAIGLDITERKQAEEKLRERERRFSDIAENALEWIWEVDANGEYTYSSPVVEEILGYKPEEILKKHFYDLSPPEDREELKKAAFEVFAQKQPFREFINRNVHKNGETVWLSTSGVPIIDEEGNLLGYRGADTDITERKQVEEALRESEYKFRVLFESTLDGLIVIDAETMKVVLANQAAAKIYGFDSAEDAIGVNPLDFVIPEDRERAFRIIAEDMFKKDLQQVNEFRALTKDGREIWVSTLGRRTEYQGRLAGLISVRDITERKQVEELARSRLELQRTISAVSSRFVRLTDIDDAINKSLADIGRFSGASRSYLFLFREDGTTVYNTHEWCAEGVSPEIENNQNVPAEEQRWITQIREGAPVQIEDVSQIPAEASAEKALLESQDIKSLLLSPAYDSQGKIIGFMGFDNVVSTGGWSDAAFTILRLSSEIIGSAIQRQQAEEITKSKLEFEKTISAISARFIRLADIDDAINKSLADIGRFSGASRAYFFLFREDGATADNTHEWCAEGVRAVIENNQNVPTEILWWMAHIRQGELVQIEDISQMPPEASAEKALLESQDIKSLLLSPAYDSQGKIIGFMGFDNVVSTGSWSDAAFTILRLSSEVIGSAIQRQRAEEITKSKLEFEKTISAISARFVSLADIDDAINKSLADIGRFSGASRAYLFLFREDGATADNTHEWCAEGVRPAIENNQNVPTEEQRWTVPTRQGELVQIEDVSRMPAEASAEKALLESQDIKSLLLSPAYDSQGKIIGFMGFDNVVSTGGWSDAAFTILRLSSEIIGSAIQRQRAERKLQEKNEQLDAQNEELQSQTEELIAQQRELQEKNEQLDAQNEELQSQAEELMAQQRELQEKNKQLDAQNEELQSRTEELIAQQQELMEKTREVEQANQLKSEFLASMSHELRTPLNAVIGFSELMLDGVPGEINDEQRQCLGDILGSGQHLLNLINDVLDLSKVEAGKMEFKLKSLNLADVINDAVQTVKPMLDDKRHKLRVSVEEGLPQVRADKSRLKQVFLNLLSNATKFTPPGGKLRIEVSRRGDWCQASVVDSGIGIKKEDQEQIFEVFTQAETLAEGKKEGTGLGLAITRQFVAAMGGRIWVDSEYGKGSRFTFTLPLVREGEPYPEEELEAGLLETKEPPLKPGQKRVLVVDDDHKARSLISAWLKPEGCTIIEASTGDEGIKKARELVPAVIILDILMPDKDGWQVLQALKSMPETRDIPVVITSVIEEKELGFSLGAVDYFVKPVDRERFQKRIVELGVTMRGKVLVVDDNPADVRLVASILEAENIGVLCAYGGEDGVRMAKENEPSLIVLDILMPDLNGFEVIDRLRQDEKTRNIPIIILTMKELTEEEFKKLWQTKTIIMKATFRREDFISEVKKVVRLGGE